MKLASNNQHLLLELAATYREGADQPTPEQTHLDELRAERSRLATAAASARMAVDDMETEILRIQEDERKLRARQRDDEASLSAETDPSRRRDLEHDRYSARSRIADLMGELMEAHNEIHALRTNAESHGARLDELDRRIAAATRARDAAASAGEATDPDTRRATLTAALPAAVVEEFEAVREENGVGAALFNGRSCSGCYMILPVADRSRIANAPADELPTCPNCGSYLVRKAA
ncbi:zinc ribbon domain-containing protein [Corynebacterium uberis]|uniref:zinc ribbon domain-containing protein n=1 Tax=Corynebacterium TaxID=1716 RepID=UPI001D0AAA1D|nr:MULTISPECIES: C4-type zinc ribbon domain-containing protein [Corynebacterium]MCZ9308240.1 C4-type zinc ribbon domain-containing protein [Corynebacterium sp. c6VSa_13]UDL73920.1 C4-type zinc ribbon domain-containing protein [Corynebacterium uberis]UDL75197.1 C4-type zinc ribbon domain-containing protein [Corynebacterium uberis]UDL77408.1 C4-type zinc ribbon domain-containing protein [Corynebacterium uberis]UDL79693.1 C4-type zinc ribbon domain-containing protein [Corynebacterium uberis]